MNTLQVGHTFAAELKSLGVEVPPDTTSIRISAKAFMEPVSILFEVANLNSNVIEKLGGQMKDKNGDVIHSTQLFNLLKNTVDFPKEVTSFEIVATVNEIVRIDISAAFPVGGLIPLKYLLK
jgi:hypothetical protein